MKKFFEWLKGNKKPEVLKIELTAEQGQEVYQMITDYRKSLDKLTAEEVLESLPHYERQLEFCKELAKEWYGPDKELANKYYVYYQTVVKMQKEFIMKK